MLRKENLPILILAIKEQIGGLMGNYVDVTDSNFEQEVLKSDVPVLVDFWAEWCAPCRVIAPLIDELSQQYSGKIKVVKMDVDQNPQSSMNYGIRSIPTLLFFKNGQPVDQLLGAVPKNQIEDKLTALILYIMADDRKLC